MPKDLFPNKFERTRNSKGRLRARCPACSTPIALRDAAEIWDLVDCPTCRTRLEIIDLRPPTLEVAGLTPHGADGDDWEEER